MSVKSPVIIVDVHRPDVRHFSTSNRHLVYWPSGICVTHTIVNGPILMEKPMLITIHEEKVMAE